MRLINVIQIVVSETNECLAKISLYGLSFYNYGLVRNKKIP